MARKYFDEATLRDAKGLVSAGAIPHQARTTIAREFWGEGREHLRWNDMSEDEQILAVANWFTRGGIPLETPATVAAVFDGRPPDEAVVRECAELKHANEVLELRLRSAFPHDRGVYNSGESYRAGEWVTYSGSLWIAQNDTSDKPGTSNAWRLSVKKGHAAERTSE